MNNQRYKARSKSNGLLRIVVEIPKNGYAFPGHRVPDYFIHCYQQQGDTGVNLELLQKYIFITLDNFLKPKQYKDIGNRLNAWLLFFASDDSEDIIRLIKAHPDFEAMYRQIYEICENVENVMGLFSEELATGRN